MDNSEIIKWLLQGDVSIQFQTYRDLLLQNRPDLQNRIATEKPKSPGPAKRQLASTKAAAA
jgi:hypothetical protein